MFKSHLQTKLRTSKQKTSKHKQMQAHTHNDEQSVPQSNIFA